MKRKVNGSKVSVSVALMTVLCGAAAFAQPWIGPIGSRNRIEYVTGSVFVGNLPVSNDVVLFDVVDSGQTGNVITFHAFAGTPLSGVRTTAIWGESNNPAGRALQGFNFATNGDGTGIWAESASRDGIGARVRATSTTGQSFGLYSDNASPGGAASYVVATATTASPIASWSHVHSPTGYSVYATGVPGSRNYFQGNAGFGTQDPMWPVVATGATNHIGSFVSTSTGTLATTIRGVVTATVPGTSQTGVSGNVENATGSNGIGGWFNHSGSGIALYGTVFDPTGFAGFFRGKVSVQGDLGVVGALSKSSGTFKIDHPLDPANKYLYHSFVESPDMMNVYNGTTITDSEGYSTVTMPEYFEALNTSFRYQLTVIDESAPDIFTVRVFQKMKGNTFVIKTFPGNLEVSWQVTGIRQDAWAKAHPVVPEVSKGPDSGRYLHPELFGAPASAAIDYGRGSVGQPEKSTVVPKGVVKSVTPVRVAPVSHEPPLTPAAQMTPAQR